MGSEFSGSGQVLTSRPRAAAFPCAENRRRFIAEHAHRACKSPFSAAERVPSAGEIFLDFPTHARFPQWLEQ